MCFKHFIFTAQSLPDLRAVCHFGLLASTKENSDPVFYLKASHTTMGYSSGDMPCIDQLKTREALRDKVLESLVKDIPAPSTLLLKFCTMKSTTSH